MALAVSRPYACPICGESFTKWGLCQTHLRTSAPCRDALGIKLQDADGLQEMCRNAASLAAPAGELVAPAAQNTEAPFPGDTFSAKDSSNQHSVAAGQLSEAALRKMKKVVTRGYLTMPEQTDLLESASELRKHPEEVQEAAVEKFLSLGPGELKWVQDKGAWLSQCLRYCARTNSKKIESDGSATSRLMGAFSHHALLPDAISQNVWDKFAQLSSEEQSRVIVAVHCSLPTTITSDHVLNLCANEQFIYDLDNLPPPRMMLQPPPMEWESIEGTLYHRLLQMLLFRQRNAEEKFFKELAEADRDMQPGDPGSLLHTHKATQAARQQGSAEVLSLLHAGAASGLVRACARLLAEGLDVNECAGHLQTSPLHIAAAHGELGVLRLLLERQADPRATDAEGRAPLYMAVEAAARFSKNARDGTGSSNGHRSQQFKTCSALILAGADTAKAEAFAKEHQLSELLTSMSVSKRLRRLHVRGITDEDTVSDLQKLQYETAGFVIGLFERYVVSQVSTEAATAELSAIILSDFVQERDRIQHLANRLAKRLHLGKKAVETLRDLPSEAAQYVLDTFKIEETVPGIFAVPEDLNSSPEQQAESPSPSGNAADGEAQPTGVSKTGEPVKKNLDPLRLRGKVRKWDPERGFGFIVQHAEPGEEVQRDIFVHRSNVVGSCPSNHIDLREHSRVTYMLGEQEGRPRALDVTMVDSNLKPLPIHSGIQTYEDEKKLGGKGDGSDNEVDEDDDITRKFMLYIRSAEVQEVIRDKRPDSDSWLRCIGLRKHNAGRRDDAIWKKEIDRRIDVLVAKHTTPLQKRDFDWRVKRFLHEFCVHSSVSRVSDVLSLIESSTVGKGRDDVRAWPAYLATLLRRFDPKLYESLSERDKRTRVENRSKRGDSAGILAGSGEANDDVVNLDPDDEGRYGDGGSNGGSGGGRLDYDSPPPDYSPRSSDVASSPRSSASDNEQGATPVRPPGAPPPPPPLPDPMAGPGANLFRLKPGQDGPAAPAGDATAMSTSEPRRNFQ